MFQFSPLASSSLWIQEGMTAHDGCRVSPFGHRRINAYVQLPDAYRSLSRPSSPVRAKASTVRPYSLDRICSLPCDKPKLTTGQAHRPTFAYTHSLGALKSPFLLGDSSFPLLPLPFLSIQLTALWVCVRSC
jgi:hypothetical protein